MSFYNRVLPYADKGEDTVLGHMKRAIQFNLDRSGVHGLPCGLLVDWNDCLALGHDGETVFVAFQLRYALKTYIEVCDLLGKSEEKQWAQIRLNTLDDNIEKHAWDGEWYLRAYRADGLKFGSRENDEGSIFFEPQPWAIMSGHTTGEKAGQLVDAVDRRLMTKYGLMLTDPPAEKVDPKVIKSRLFNKGMKENGAIFCHTQSWGVIAKAMLGRGDEAYDLYRKFMPSAYNTKAELREIEPYVYNQFIHSKYSPRYGAGRLPWLSGTASWAYYTISQYILGIQPDYAGLKIDPCIPSKWKEIKITRIFRKKNFNIVIKNPNGVQKGVKQLILNGEEINGNLIPSERMREKNEVLVVMG